MSEKIGNLLDGYTFHSVKHCWSHLPSWFWPIIWHIILNIDNRFNIKSYIIVIYIDFVNKITWWTTVRLTYIQIHIPNALLKSFTMNVVIGITLKGNVKPFISCFKYSPGFQCSPYFERNVTTTFPCNIQLHEVSEVIVQHFSKFEMQSLKEDANKKYPCRLKFIYSILAITR